MTLRFWVFLYRLKNIILSCNGNRIAERDIQIREKDRMDWGGGGGGEGSQGV